jgi:5-formyltetrahydrofolate cyclo-ligase
MFFHVILFARFLISNCLLHYFEVALSYSVQIVEDGIIPVNSTDVPIDALVSPSGIIPISPAALEMS